MDETLRKGPLEGASRVLRELLRTPRFKQTVRIILSELDPENAALLVRTIMWEDPEFFLSLLGATPALLNTLISAGNEVISQVTVFPPAVLTGFASGVISEIDARTLGHSAGQALALAARLAALDDPSLEAATRGFWTGVGEGIAGSVKAEAGEGVAGLLLDTLVPMLGSVVSRLGTEAVREGSEARTLVKGIASSIRGIASDNPEFMKEVVAPLVAAGREALSDVEESGLEQSGGEA